MRFSREGPQAFSSTSRRNEIQRINWLAGRGLQGGARRIMLKKPVISCQFSVLSFSQRGLRRFSSHPRPTSAVIASTAAGIAPARMS